MSIIKLLDEFSSEKLTTKSSSRREMFNTLGSFGKKAAAAAIPFGMAANSAKAASSSAMFYDHEGPLGLALVLEYLEAEFYMKALESGVIPAGGRAEKVYMQISKHEDAHVALLKSVLDDAGEDTTSPMFDFTAGGAFDPFNTSGEVDMDTSYAQLLALAQAFEDTGVRAYKGQAPALMGTPYLETALQIHSVEARHASEIRRIRGLEGWITLNNRGADMPEATQAVYDGEELTTQADIDLVGYDYGDSPLVGDPAEAVSQAFDEPITAETATAIASLFIVSEDDSDG